MEGKDVDRCFGRVRARGKGWSCEGGKDVRDG